MQKSANISTKDRKHITASEWTVLILILIQIVFLTVLFGFMKQGYHGDEIANMGFAGSSEQTLLWTDGRVETNIGQWVDSSVLKDYITVDASERWDYASVYQNAANDLNPPFQYFAVHAIASLFPGVYSKWFCFAVNMIAFVLIQIYLYRLVKSITGNHKAGLAAIIVFGFGFGMINIVFFLRIYALAIAFAVMFAYYSHEVYANRKTTDKRGILLLMTAISCFLGCMTLHLFLIYAFGLVVCYVLYYLFSGKIKLFFQYGLVTGGSVLLSFIVFPSTYRHVFGVKAEGAASSLCYMQKMYPADWQFRLYWYFLLRDLCGFTISPWPTLVLPYVGIAIGVLLFVLVPLCFISRNETWFKSGVNGAKELLKKVWNKAKKFCFTIPFLMVSVLFILFIASRRTSIYSMGPYSNRYIFIAYPFFIAFAVSVVYYILSWIIKKQKLRSAILIGLAIFFAGISFDIGMFTTTRSYFMEHSEGPICLTDLEEDANCIILADYPFLMDCFAPEISQTKSFFITLPKDYKQCDYSSDLDLSKPLYLVINQNFLNILDMKDKAESMENLENVAFDETENTSLDEVQVKSMSMYSDKDVLEYFYTLDFVNSIQYVGKDAVFGREVHIYRVR